MSKNPFSLGLYRHFKGDYFYVSSVVKDENSGYYNAVYLNVLKPELGMFTRNLDEFCSDVSGIDEEGHIEFIVDRKDNVTGQYHRFEKVVNLDNYVENLSTEQLIEELSKREDSPLQKLDIEGLSNLVFCTDYVVGESAEATKEHPRGVYTIASFDTEIEAKRYYATHKLRKGTKVFKRTFIEVK